MDKKLLCVEVQVYTGGKGENVITELMEVESDDPESLAELVTEIERRFKKFCTISVPGYKSATSNVLIHMRNEENFLAPLFAGLKGATLLPKLMVSLGEVHSVVAP